MSADLGPLASMTGFARTVGRHGTLEWAWEARSVNGRSLDVRCRLPSGVERLEPIVRARVARRFKRGNVSLQLTLTRPEGTVAMRVNRPLLDQILAIARDLEAAGVAPPRLDGLLALRGVLEPVDEPDEAERAALDAALERSLDEVLEQLEAARTTEGANLLSALLGHLDGIERLVQAAAEAGAAQPAALKQRLQEQLKTLLDVSPALPEDRLAQELAILVGKADVREELDRLSAHLSQARSLLGTGEPIGRRLDFLCQELNREANTLCSKAADLALTQLGLDLKAVIEQLREQVQNIE